MASTLARMLLRAAGRLPVVTRRPAHRFEAAEAGPQAEVPSDAEVQGRQPAGPATAGMQAMPTAPAMQAAFDPPFRPAGPRPAPMPSDEAATPPHGHDGPPDAGRFGPTGPPAGQAAAAPRASWPTDLPSARPAEAPPWPGLAARRTGSVELSRQAGTEAARPAPGSDPPQSAPAQAATPRPAPTPWPGAAGHHAAPFARALPLQHTPDAPPPRAPLVRPPPRALPGAALPRPAAGPAAPHGAAAAAAPEVQVRIGSVEIRAMPAAQRPQPLPPSSLPAAVPGATPLGLADYLAGRRQP